LEDRLGINDEIIFDNIFFFTVFGQGFLFAVFEQEFLFAVFW